MQRVIAAGLIAALAAAPALAQDDALATGSLLQGCRGLVENDPNGNAMQIGACAGAVSAVVDIGRALGRVCAPPGGGVEQAARVVIGFVDEDPARRAERFGPLALRALGDRWPCRQ